MLKQNHIIDSGHSDRPITLDIRWENGEDLPLLIFVHGFKGFKDWGTWNLLADHFAAQGFAFLKLNLSHNGTTPEALNDFGNLEAFGENNFGIELNDLGVVLSWLETQDFPIELQRIGLIGHSRGGSLVILKASEDARIKAVSSWAALADLVERYAPEDKREQWQKTGVDYVLNGRTGQQMPMYFQLFEDTRANAHRYSVQAAAERMLQPLLVVHGTRDPAVDYKDGYKIRDWHGAAEWLSVTGADHVFGSSHPYTEVVLPVPLQEVYKKAVHFFGTHLISSPKI